MSTEHSTLRAVGRLWKERGRREREERAPERRKRGKRARSGADFSLHILSQAPQAPGIQVRLLARGAAAAPPARGEPLAAPGMALFMWDA